MPVDGPLALPSAYESTKHITHNHPPTVKRSASSSGVGCGAIKRGSGACAVDDDGGPALAEREPLCVYIYVCVYFVECVGCVSGEDNENGNGASV